MGGLVAGVILPLLLATRPKTLPAAIVPVWVACVLSWKLTGDCDFVLASATLGGAVFIQIATNLFNDAIDAEKGADTERRTGPKRVTASGLMSRSAVMGWAGLFLVLALACGVLLYRAAGWPILAIGLPSLYLAYGYTGGPLPLAYRGLGEIFVILFFGLVAVAGTVFIQTGQWRMEALLLGGQVGLLSAVLISINNLRDREEDSGTGKRTLAVRLGSRAARLLVWLEIKVAVFLGLAWFHYDLGWLVLATLPVWTLGLRVLWGVFTLPEGQRMNRLLALAALQLIAFAGLFHFLAAKF
ncbi:MAG: 1,4-dihydroxy-2-naphthoate octaprenyltransferase [Verrucomicrobia bacterium]|nr:MAG: 1,4-dihydroxy-2-naphthoate octaprenyltransferase [Verrucomicrobiota bacterium]TAE89209.1 MAG: 1,4-dihydroxy-2-naphthoate octaprenyltransferase [Verrucomicrobiota bacterium]TAF27915.1 MAG: 1,4-dihydroxy-2-naphthoate octaprenyltransferase [Verrucomicrobiota bacterium]TAF42764.1 MAG: 1,4-dihydroxy-2-naphthoate octaprenyltransferase [Verrucomicrobiota bacterium]